MRKKIQLQELGILKHSRRGWREGRPDLIDPVISAWNSPLNPNTKLDIFFRTIKNLLHLFLQASMSSGVFSSYLLWTRTLRSMNHLVFLSLWPSSITSSKKTFTKKTYHTLNRFFYILSFYHLFRISVTFFNLVVVSCILDHYNYLRLATSILISAIWVQNRLKKNESSLGLSIFQIFKPLHKYNYSVLKEKNMDRSWWVFISFFKLRPLTLPQEKGLLIRQKGEAAQGSQTSDFLVRGR